MDNKENRFKKYDLLVKLSLLVFFVIYVFLIYKNYPKVLDSDMSAEMVLAKFLNDTKSGLVSSAWEYGNELRLFHLKSLYRIFLLLFPNNWLLVRTISHAILMVLLQVSFYFVLKNSGIRIKGIYISIILMLPISFWYTFYGLYGGFYLIFIIEDFILLAFVLKQNKSKISYLLMLLLGIMIGLNGMKSIIYFVIANVIMAFMLFVNKKQDDI